MSGASAPTTRTESTSDGGTMTITTGTNGASVAVRTNAAGAVTGVVVRSGTDNQTTILVNSNGGQSAEGAGVK